MSKLGWGVLVLGVVVTGIIGALVDSGSHSVSDTLYGAAGPVLLVWVAVAGVLVMIGRRSRMDGP